jgi:hypothetical protein
MNEKGTRDDVLVPVDGNVPLTKHLSKLGRGEKPCALPTSDDVLHIEEVEHRIVG